jgi:nicotinate-nucleotide pyrophosphorylase
MVHKESMSGCVPSGIQQQYELKMMMGGVDYVSVGKLTHSAVGVDVGLDEG